MVYFIGWSLFLLFFKFYLGFAVVGRENVPKKGPFIFASNHTSYFDPVLLGTSLYRSLNYMARENLFKRRCFGWIMRKLHAFPIKRNEGDLGAIRGSLKLLGEGKPLVIFPEGTRAKDRELRKAKPGIGLIVAKARVPVIPAYIDGSFDALPRGIRTLKRHPVRVFIGKPIDFKPNLSNASRKETYQNISDEIMRNIERLRETYIGKAGGTKGSVSSIPRVERCE